MKQFELYSKTPKKPKKNAFIRNLENEIEKDGEFSLEDSDDQTIQCYTHRKFIILRKI